MIISMDHLDLAMEKERTREESALSAVSEKKCLKMRLYERL